LDDKNKSLFKLNSVSHLTRIRKNDTSFAQTTKLTHANAYAMTQLLSRAVFFRFMLRERYRHHVVAVHGR